MNEISLSNHNTSNNKPIVVIFIITGLGTGGAEVMLYQLLTKINKQRFQASVVSLMDYGTFGIPLENLGITVYSLGMKRGVPTPNTFRQLMKIVNEVKPDVIQGWMYHGNLAAYFANLFSSNPSHVYWSIHHSIKSLELEKSMTRVIIRVCGYFSRFIAKTIFVSKNSKLQHEAIGYSCENSCVIPNGFDVLSFQPSVESRLKFRKELNLSKDCILIGLMCRFHPMKDHLNFLNASVLLSQKFPDVKFVLAGTNVDNKNDFLLDKIKQLGLEDKTYLLGERQDIPNIIPALDIMTMASAYGEAFPLIVGESMSCGVPCVVTDVGDASWIVGDTGKVVPPRNPEALADAWQELIAMDMEARDKLGIAARSRVINSFSLDSIVSKYEHLYESC
ncbi:glycosyltransferase family 4 protein [Calothrix sp. PCC 6303]|uniref:glycosyltransferase family 4 protein n=1 Tax=Calothrix sp. PCC 6303 TaxID=1170562 RepID=UPI0002A034BD|nr:glycosyltransferase [Calothrix sp. PCC 6303]AFZ00162.1 glycosyl transferase group 1 [Calothrix sp. PCC 6303]